MTRTRELRNNPDNCINIVDTIIFFFPELKPKYIELIVRLLKQDTIKSEQIKSIYRDMFGPRFNHLIDIPADEINPVKSLIQIQIIQRISDRISLDFIDQFVDYNERGLIKNNDLLKYKTFDEIVRSVSAAGIKDLNKNMEKQAIKVYESENWILVRPLSPLASKKYGSGTKWCTTSQDNDYFIRYSSDGILIYCINKVNGNKVAVYKPLLNSRDGFSFWNETDTRIDSIETGLPKDIINAIVNEINSNPRTNMSYLSEMERVGAQVNMGDEEIGRDELQRGIMDIDPRMGLRNLEEGLPWINDNIGIVGTAIGAINQEVEDRGF